MGQLRALLDDGDQHVGRHRDPDLRLDRVLAGAEERLDAQVLLDPLKKSSTCQRQRYRSAMLKAGKPNWLVKNTRRLRVFGSMYLMRRSGTGNPLWE